ncbi:MAG: methyltransferase domain-containing protein [Myxococcales bacterium]|jgi:2-polyprenyl-3-methyl-5-hydroxy-6-metoxy-1,4-benzoquinol methylase|nr:methyltransferase domain-containing protein [Myxococcales bacterium]
MSFDAWKAEAFAEKVLDSMNKGTLALMISLGHRTGLFDTMVSMDWGTSDEIARRAGLDERYVREWLGAMVTGGVVEIDPASRTYRLPAEHAASLTRASSPNNLAVYGQYLGIMGAVEDDIVECFRRGGGVPYEKFPRFHEVMAEDSGQTVLPALFDGILPLVFPSFEPLERGIDVLDVGCGRGRALVMMAERFPNSRFRGLDLSEEATAYGRAIARERGLDNLEFAVMDLRDFHEEAEPERYDFVTTFDAVHDQPKPKHLLAGIRRTLRPGGAYLMQDIKASSFPEKNVEHPMGTWIYTVSTFHCMTVSLAQGGDGLGTAWGRELARSMLAEAGFEDVEVYELPHDPQNDYWVMRV